MEGWHGRSPVSYTPLFGLDAAAARAVAAWLALNAALEAPFAKAGISAIGVRREATRPWALRLLFAALLAETPTEARVSRRARCERAGCVLSLIHIC